ncbi:RDD family protein [Nocardiopsis algeriensis]|uniref:Putative RDD family membrane protein YckC n=1 Tax=Nocardiopsis algeriensis TaxID=1478215 RepID=A0A841IVI2_9ACTN|nr:RDD family protein [Nocardiopsis algeriensis]MBB6120211.1 putative RDD family membrane protein YckC [Nocardiopsis algeriensis]
MSSPYWNPQDPARGVHPSAGGWGPVQPPVPAHLPPYPGGAPQQVPASFGLRFSARLIDYLLTGVAAVAFFFLMVMVTMVLTGSEETSDAEGTVWAMLFLFGWGPLLFFYDWLYLVTWGRTLGKMMLGIKVVRADGGRLTQGQAMGRAAVFGLPQSLLCVGHIFSAAESMAALGDARGRALHDRMAGTVVIRS